MNRTWLALVLVPGLAAAFPADWVHDVEPGREKFIRLPELDWFEVEDPAVAELEWLPSGELLVTGKARGRTLVLLGAQGQVALWVVRVGTPPRAPSAALQAEARKACPGVELARGRVTATVDSEACRLALHALFATDIAEARHLELTFTPEVLEGQLALVRRALEAGKIRGVEVRQVGAGLKLEGRAPAATYRRALWVLVHTVVGRLALEDRVEVEAPPLAAPPAPDGGVGETG